MSTAIQFLASLGAQPTASAAEYAAILAGLEIDSAQRKALMDGDHETLSELLDGRTKMFCFVATPNENEPDAVPDDADGDGIPDQDEPEHERE